MVAMLKEFPEFHATFNLVPSLVSQLQEYARDEVREQAFELAFRPVDRLSPAERGKLIEFSFQLNLKNLVNRFPGLRELYDKVHYRVYQHPEDAVEHLRAAVKLHEQVFGRRPRGVWPSEGGVSDQVLTWINHEFCLRGQEGWVSTPPS